MITKELINGIVAFDGGGRPVVSMYVGVDPADRAGLTTRVKSLLAQVRVLEEDHSLTRDVRLSLRGDIQRIEEAATHHLGESGTVAWFSCTAARLFTEVTLPRRVRDQVVTDVTPWTRPMLAVLGEYHRACVVVIDKREATIWELYRGEMREAVRVSEPMVRKPDYAGFAGRDEHRVRNKVETQMRAHFRRTATLLDERFRTDGYELLIIGGHEEEVTLFVGFLHKHLRPRLAGTFTVDTGSANQAEIQLKAQGIVDRYDREEQCRHVAEVFERAAVGGLATVGPERCLWAGSVAAVQHLLVQDGELTPGVVCDGCGWLALAGHTCPLCGGTTRRTPDVLGEVAESVIEEGGSVEHVQTDTELSEYMMAAALRFPLPPQPQPVG
jgi:peptide chain release factor subunit 1